MKPKTRIPLAAAGLVYALFAAGCLRLAVEHGYERGVSIGEGSFVLLGQLRFSSPLFDRDGKPQLWRSERCRLSAGSWRPPGTPSLFSSVELEAPWQEVNRAIDALLRREIAGKAVLHVTRKHTFSA